MPSLHCNPYPNSCLDSEGKITADLCIVQLTNLEDPKRFWGAVEDASGRRACNHEWNDLESLEVVPTTCSEQGEVLGEVEPGCRCIV